LDPVTALAVSLSSSSIPGGLYHVIPRSRTASMKPEQADTASCVETTWVIAPGSAASTRSGSVREPDFPSTATGHLAARSATMATSLPLP